MSGEAFERGYAAGYRAALGAAAAECRKHAEALDHGGNTYTRYGDAIRLSCAVLALRVPAIDEAVAVGVDDAMVRRACMAYEVALDGEVYGPEAPESAMRAALTAALAGHAPAVGGGVDPAAPGAYQCVEYAATPAAAAPGGGVYVCCGEDGPYGCCGQYEKDAQ